MHRLCLSVGFLLVAVWGPCACKALKTGAREEFATKYSCPDDRVQVVERGDLQAFDLLAANRDTSADVPPAEVAADRERLAKWRTDREESNKQNRRSYNSAYRVFEVRGCNHEALMACTHPQNGSGGTLVGRVHCTEKDDSLKSKTEKPKD
jgi:hypothetical protein